MRRVCAWCSLVLDEGDVGSETTHTICGACFDRLEQEDLSRPSGQGQTDAGGPSQSCGGSGAGLGDRSQRGRDSLWPLSMRVTWALFGLAYVALCLVLWRP